MRIFKQLAADFPDRLEWRHALAEAYGIRGLAILDAGDHERTVSDIEKGDADKAIADLSESLELSLTTRQSGTCVPRHDGMPVGATSTSRTRETILKRFGNTEDAGTACWTAWTSPFAGCGRRWSTAPPWPREGLLEAIPLRANMPAHSECSFTAPGRTSKRSSS